jgi:hypothetical protein
MCSVGFTVFPPDHGHRLSTRGKRRAVTTPTSGSRTGGNPSSRKPVGRENDKASNALPDNLCPVTHCSRWFPCYHAEYMSDILLCGYARIAQVREADPVMPVTAAWAVRTCRFGISGSEMKFP